MNSFSEFSLCTALQSNLVRNGLVSPTPVQVESIPAALAGHDIVATAQTGTGKTLGFVVPMLESLLKSRKTGVSALVLSPTRELAMQINETFLKMAAGTGIRSALIVGGLSESHQIRGIRGGAQVLIATPGRLCDFLERKLVNLSGVHFLVLDEADRMLDMGFLPSIRTILKTTPHTRQTLFFSATIEKSVAHLIDSNSRNPVRVAIGPAAKPHDQVDLQLYEVEADRKLSLLANLLRGEQGTFLVFARTKHGADRLSKKLSGTGVKTTRIHGGRTQNQRNEALRGFKEGSYRVLVATDVAARGIHVDAIGHVVNYDLPQTSEDFIHRVGRTGRAGATGVAWTFSTRSERSEIRKIERELGLRMVLRETPGDLVEIVSTSPAIRTFPRPNNSHRSTKVVWQSSRQRRRSA